MLAYGSSTVSSGEVFYSVSQSCGQNVPLVNEKVHVLQSKFISEEASVCSGGACSHSFCISTQELTLL